MEHWTAGDYGGAFAGGVAGLAALGKGLAWLLNWQGARSDRREKRLSLWEDSLAEREREYRVEIGARLAKLESIEEQVAHLRSQNAALGISLHDVTVALRERDKRNPALARAAAVLRAAFPLEQSLPPAIAELLARLEAEGNLP